MGNSWQQVGGGAVEEGQRAAMEREGMREEGLRGVMRVRGQVEHEV